MHAAINLLAKKPLPQQKGKEIKISLLYDFFSLCGPSPSNEPTHDVSTA